MQNKSNQRKKENYEYEVNEHTLHEDYYYKIFNFFPTSKNLKDQGRLCAYASLPLIPVPSKVILPAIMQHAVVMMVMMFGCGLEGW